MPTKITLGTQCRAKGFGSKRCIVEREEVMVYVPILEILQKLISNEMVTAEVG